MCCPPDVTKTKTETTTKHGSSLVCICGSTDCLTSSSVVSQLPGKKDLFIEADLMSPLDRIANVSTLKVSYYCPASPDEASLKKCCSSKEFLKAFCPFNWQQHEVDKLYKVEHKPVITTSDQ